MQDPDTFDLQIRSMLADAEEPVPAGAWEAVSGALDRKARRAALLPVWRWTALSLAAAAALVAGIFLFTPNPSPESVSDTALLAEATAPATEQSSASPLIPASPATDEISVGGVSAEGLSTPGQGQGEGPVECKLSASPMTQQAMGGAGAARSDAESFCGHSAGTSSVAENEQTVEKKIAETAKKEEESFDILNPEADLVEGAPQKERRRLALVAGGNMESNASPSRSRFSGRKAAPLFQKTGVAEHGDNSSYGIPLTIGIGLKWNFTPHWALGTGIGYSYLSRSFTGTYTEMNDGLLVRQVTADIDNGLQYLGIPLNLYYQFSDTRPVQFYAFTGMTVEKGVQNRFRIKDAAGDILYRESVDGVQVSFALGIGVGFRLTDHVSLYFDPSLRYYLENGQPKSIRTAQPLMMSVEAGLRFDL